MWGGANKHFPINHESSALLYLLVVLHFWTDQTMMRGWKRLPFAPLIPLPPISPNYSSCTAYNILFSNVSIPLVLVYYYTQETNLEIYIRTIEKSFRISLLLLSWYIKSIIIPKKKKKKKKATIDLCIVPNPEVFFSYSYSHIFLRSNKSVVIFINWKKRFFQKK